MKLNEYFSLADIATLSKEQFEALRNYLKFIGIVFDDSHENIMIYNSKYPEYVFTAWDTCGLSTTPYITLTHLEDDEITTRHDINDILRMVAIGEAMTHEC